MSIMTYTIYIISYKSQKKRLTIDIPSYIIRVLPKMSTLHWAYLGNSPMSPVNPKGDWGREISSSCWRHKPALGHNPRRRSACSLHERLGQGAVERGDNISCTHVLNLKLLVTWNKVDICFGIPAINCVKISWQDAHTPPSPNPHGLLLQ